MLDISRIWMNRQASWVGQSLQAARMPVWTTLPTCHVRTLGLLYWQHHGCREWAARVQQPDIYPDVQGHPDWHSGFGGTKDKDTPRTLPSWVWASYWPLWVSFWNFFQKTVNCGDVSKGSIKATLPFPHYRLLDRIWCSRYNQGRI